MPASERSLELTDSYRDELREQRLQTVATLAAAWALVDEQDLDVSYATFVAVAAATIAAGQRVGVGLTSAYLAAYVMSEIGELAAPGPAEGDYLGLDRFGRPLERALAPPLLTIKATLAGGAVMTIALAYGLQRALRIGSDAVAAAPRAALADSIAGDPKITGWRRVVSGPSSCGACLGAADGKVHGADEPFAWHICCDCVQQLIVAGARDTVRSPTGAEIFDAMSTAEQDELFRGRGGERKAALIRSGKAALSDLITHQPQVLDGPPMITETPLARLL